MLDRQMLRRLAGSGSFSRGEAYFAGGHVRSLDEHRGAVVAKVQGSAAYAVKLWAEGKELGYSCSCPRGNDRYLDSVRAAHARKRNFMRLLSRANWAHAGGAANP